MPNKITYTIKTSDGKEHQVSKENIDKHGIQAYADAYKGATIRMRDSKKGDYDIPLANYNDAKAQGLHAFSWEHKPVVASQNNSQATQKQPASKVNTTQGTPMTATQKAQVLDNTNSLITQSQSAIGETILKNKVALDRTKKPFSNINNITLGRKNSGSIGSDKVKGHTIDGKKVYSDDKGNIYDSTNSAVSEVQERMIDRDGLSKRIAALSVENENANKRLNEIREKYQKQLNPTQIYGQNGTAGNFNALDKLLENDDEYMMLLTTTRNNQRSLDILRNKQQENNDKHNGVNVFGRSIKSLGRGMRDYFKTDFDPMGDATGKDALAYMRAEKIVETLSKKLQTGETLSTKEKATLALFNSYNQQQDISGDDNLSSWMYSGGRGVSLSAEFGAMIASGAGSFQTIAEKTAQGASKAALSQITKYLGKGVAKNIGTKIATKAVGSVAGMMSSGLAYTSTVGFKKTFANAMQNYVGEMGVTEDGQIAFGEYVKDKEGKVSFKRKDGGITDLVTAFAKAGYEQTKENGTEMLGETLPSITKILKGIGGTAKFVSKLEKIGATPFVESINKALRMTGYNGLPSQGIEEYAGLLSDVIFSDASLKDFGKLQTHLDIWGNVALTSGVMSSVQVAGIGTGAAMFYKYKHQNDKAGKKAQALIGDKWNGIQEVLDNTVNAEFSGALAGILSREDLNGEQKKRVVNYANSLLKMRGFNIGFNNDKMGRMASSGEKGIDGAISEVSYAAGYNATEDELANIKNELELRHRQLAETFKDDPSALQQIEEDPKAFLQGLKESEVGGEKAKVINAYEETRAAYDGMIQRVKDNIDDAVTENNTVIEQRTHQDGNIYPATMKLDDRKVYVVGGNVQMNEDGKGIDHEKSSSSVMIRDAETGKIEMVDPSAILSVDTPVNAEEEKATSSEQIKQTYAQEQANKIDGVLEFKAGDTYSILGEDQKQHTIQIIGEAIDEKTKQPNPDMVMASIDGLEPTMLPKEQIQAMNDEENLWRLEQSLKQDEDVENTTPHSAQSYNLNDEITLINEDGKPVRGSITTDQNEDGKFEVYTEEPINGKRVNLFTAEELDAMTGKQQEQTTQAPVQGEQMESPALVSGMNDGTIAENATVQKEETPQHEPTALERIPTNEQGEPIYEQADPETAWDAIVEQTEGDESIAQSVADGMVADMEAAVRRAEKAKVKGGTTIAEKIAAEKERVATIEQAKATLEHWKKIASTNSRRQEAIQAEESRKAKEAALLRKEQEEKERAMREEEERVKREALNGVPDIVEDKAIDARARGYRRISGDKVDRQEPLNAIKGKEVQVKFDDKNIPTGHVSLIDVDELQPSHKNGYRNPLHFIDEAQPKERKDDASIDAARKIAANIRPEEITSSVTAYTGAPTVNSRGEVIQGNNRSAALKEMWAMHKEQGEKYKQYIIDHAEELGLNPADVRSMKHPVLVNMLDVNDNDAISLGQFVASDTESGGTERIKPKNVVKKLGNRMKTFANILLRTTDEDMSFAELIDRNGVEALKWMNANGSITSTQYKSAFDSKGNLTAEAKNDLKGVMYQSIFEGGSTQLEEMFNALPIKAQKAILATAYRDYDSPTTERMVEEIQNSIMAYYALSLDEQFKAATNHKSARWAVESWKRQYAIDDSTGESYLPSEKYSNFALLLATMYKGDSQSFIQGTFKQMYDLIQGTQEDNLFEQPDNTPRTLVEAIKETLNIEYDGQQRSDILASNSTASQQGEQRSNGNSKTGGRSETRNGSKDYQGGTQGDSGRSRSEQSSGGSQEEITERNSHLTEKEADEQDLADKKELEDFIAQTDSNNRTKIDESKYDAEDLFAPLLLDGKSSNLAVMTFVSDNINDPSLQIAVYDYSFDIDNKTNSGWQKWGDLADEYNAHVAEEDRTWEPNDNAMLEFRTVDAAVKFNDWLKAKEDGKSNVVHSFGNSASQNDTSIKLSDTSFAKMENGEQKAEREIGWLVDHNIRLEENSRKLDEIAHLLFDGDNIDSNRESTLREEAKKILEENEKLSRDYQKNYSDKYFGTDDITANYILQEANERLIALGVKPVKESYYFQSRKNEIAQNAVVQLLKRIGIPVHVISRVGAEVSGQGNSRGWTNGLDIWLTKDNINAETPVHEYTHIWTFALMKKNPKLWAEIKNLLKDSEWVDAIQSMDEYKYALDNEDLLYSEVLSRISGERNGEKFESMAFKLIEEVNSVEKKVDLKRGLEKLRDALKRFWEWVGVNLFGMKEFKSVDDVCDRVLFDLLNASDIARTEEMREYYEEEREMNTIIDKAKEDGTYLKTPSGEDSKLPEKVWAYARTKKFKTQLSDRLNLILNESKEDFKDWEKEEFRDLFKKHDLLEENNEPGRFLVSQFMYSEKYYDRKGKMQEEAKETMNSGKGEKNVSSVKSVDMRDAEYIKAVENNDTETIQRLLSEEAERKGYSNDSSYQGSLAFNGSAPYQNAYFETKEERKEAWENDEYEDTMSLGDYVDSGIDTNNLEWNLTDPMALRQADPDRREAIENLRQTVRSNSKTITIYRAVDANIKENEIRNGDWVTPSRSYAEYHIGLQDWENGRIIEQEVSIDDLWWDGNDIAEWGYDNGKGEVYKNTPNNRKMFEVTYDDKGNIIPLSKRFNDQVEDERFRNDEELEEANQRFNEELENLTEENADKVTLWLGKPSDVLLSSGIENKPLKLYGNKVIKKMKKHGFALDELRDLPKAVADPIAVFDNYQREGNRTILTELRSQEKNIMVAVTLGKNGVDVDFNIVSSVFGKGSSNVVDWISKGYLAYVDKEKALNYLYFSERNISEAADNSRLSSAANIVKSFENPINNSEKKLDRKSTQGKEVTEKERQQMAERANELAETLHLDNVEIVTDASTLEGKKAKAKGFYSTSTGKITIVIPNHSNIADVEKTLLHEAVAHHGLRKLFGEHFDNFLDNVFKNASEDVRREIVKLAAKNKWDFRIATEEYLASLAEDTNFEKMPNGLWDKVKRLFLDMLRSIGLLKQKDGEWNDNELRYILWRSYKNLKEKGQSNSILNKAEDIAMQHRLKVGNYSESTDKEVRFRDGEPQSKERVSAAERYEHRVSRSMFQSQEALQDSMLGLKEAMDAIMRAEGKEMYMEDIEGFENAYLGENRLSSVNQAETEAFAHLVFKPMLDEVAKLAKNDKERSELTDYMMAKHGLERNEVMRKNALEEIINNEKLSDAQKNARASIAEHRDYAGLTALTDANSVEEAESEAQRMVEEYEQKHDTTNLWDKVNTVTKGILSKSYECGMMNKQTYEKVRDMYQFYIPLRGFDEETSREAYAYLSHGQSAFNAPIKTAKGRSSKADDPFANMQSMAESAIMQGNRNVLVKQKFLNFALNHPSDLVSVNALWLKYDDVKEEWRPVFPDNIEETDTADEVEKKIQDFEQRMAELAKQDPERYKHGKDTENIPYRIVESRDLRQHQVVVKRNGRDYVLTINGNPRAAQALNGLTNPDNDVSGAIGAILNFGEKINRQLSAFYTTRNPDFVVSNFIRDMLYANSIVWVKERPNYALRFHRNIGRCNPAQMKILLSKHKKGELDMNNSLEHMFHQFIMNGGETGYANVRDIEQHKNDIQRELKRANGKIGIKRSLSLLGEKLDEYNRAVENCARFAAFLTSREMGRTIDRSIYDAKDISVNFNKKGSGAKFMKATGQTKLGKTSAFISGIGRSGYVFWNAAIQGTTNFGRQFKRHPAKAFTASATMFILGALIAGMGMGDDGDDDKNSYWNLPESVRRSNILFRTGDQWISIPLPVEYRSIYGMGELMISAMSGKEHFTDAELGKAIAGQATQILPIDFLEGEGGVKAFVPSAVKPFAEVISNKGWTGMPIYKDTPYNKNMPEWTKTYKSANKYLIGLAKTLNEVTGGDAYTKGAVNINPAQIEYLLNGYFGGVSNTIDKLTKSAETIAGKRDYDPKSFLLLNRVLKSGDERTEERAINREYYRLKEEYEILRDRLKNYENDTDNGVFDFSEKINFLYNSPEYARYEIFEDYREDIEGLYKELKDPMSDEERASIEAELTGLKKQMIEEMNATRK